MDESAYGKEVRRLANAWHSDGGYSEWAADFHKRQYLADREASYADICAAYAAAGQTPPGREVMSGR